MKALVRLTHSVDLIVEGDDLDQITDWAEEHTPSTAYEDCAKVGHIIGESYDETVTPLDKYRGRVDIDIKS